MSEEYIRVRHEQAEKDRVFLIRKTDKEILKTSNRIALRELHKTGLIGSWFHDIASRLKEIEPITNEVFIGVFDGRI